MLWKFHFSFPNVLNPTVLLTYGQGHFLLPIKQNCIFYGKSVTPLAPKKTLSATLAHARVGGLTGKLQRVEVYQILYLGSIDPMDVFYADDDKPIAVNV